MYWYLLFKAKFIKKFQYNRGNFDYFKIKLIILSVLHQLNANQSWSSQNYLELRLTSNSIGRILANHRYYLQQQEVVIYRDNEQHEGGLASLQDAQPAIATKGQLLEFERIQPRKIRQEVHPDPENRSLEDLALQQMGFVDIAIIAEQDHYNNNNPIAAPLPLVSDPFWQEFNEWRQNNPDDYAIWLQNLPESDIADQNDDNNATGDNAPAKKKNKRNDDDTSSDDTF